MAPLVQSFGNKLYTLKHRFSTCCSYWITKQICENLGLSLGEVRAEASLPEDIHVGAKLAKVMG